MSVYDQDYIDKRQYQALENENGLLKAVIQNLLLSLDKAPSAPKLGQSIAAARHVLDVHGAE